MANTKDSALTTVTSFATTDKVRMVTNPATNPRSVLVTIVNFVSYLFAGLTTAIAGDDVDPDNDYLGLQDYSAGTAKKLTVTELQQAIDLVRTATFVVAAADSSARCKAAADYVCDGTSDEVQINAAIAALPAAGTLDILGSTSTTTKKQGGTVLLVEGTYSIAAEVSLTGRHDVTLMGLGSSTVINNTATDGGNAIEALNTDTVYNRVYVRDLLVQGNAASGSGIVMQDCNYNGVINCTVQGNGRHGIHLKAGVSGGPGESGAENKIISGCQILFNGYDGIRCEKTHETIISHCHIEENSTAGTYSGIHGLNCFNLIIVGNSIEDHPYQEIKIITDSNAVGDSNAHVISGNVIEGGIVLGAGSATYTVNNTNISGNVIDGGITISVASATLTFERINIVGNLIRNDSARSLLLNKLKNSIIANNIFAGLTTTNGAGNLFFGGCSDIKVSGNKCSIGNSNLSTKAAFVLDVQSTVNCSDITFEDNTVIYKAGSGTDAYVNMSNVAHDSIRFINNRWNKFDSTVLENGFIIGAACTNTVIRGGKIAGCTTVLVDSSGLAIVEGVDGYNPIGVTANPFDNTNHRVGMSGSAAAPVASQDYSVITADCRMISTGGTGVDITVKDAAGNTIKAAGATCDEWLKRGWKVNFGAFSGAPTVVVAIC